MPCGQGSEPNVSEFFASYPVSTPLRCVNLRQFVALKHVEETLRAANAGTKTARDCVILASRHSICIKRNLGQVGLRWTEAICILIAIDSSNIPANPIPLIII